MVGACAGLTVVVAAVTTGALVSAPPANADANGFLWEIHAVGAHHGTGDDFMVGLGVAACQDLADGATIYDIAAALTQSPGSPFTPFEAAEIIYASVDQLCPPYKPLALEQVSDPAYDGRSQWA